LKNQSKLWKRWRIKFSYHCVTECTIKRSLGVLFCLITQRDVMVRNWFNSSLNVNLLPSIIDRSHLPCIQSGNLHFEFSTSAGIFFLGTKNRSNQSNQHSLQKFSLTCFDSSLKFIESIESYVWLTYGAIK